LQALLKPVSQVRILPGAPPFAQVSGAYGSVAVRASCDWDNEWGHPAVIRRRLRVTGQSHTQGTIAPTPVGAASQTS
jgi:hypothetical protein